MPRCLVCGCSITSGTSRTAPDGTPPFISSIEKLSASRSFSSSRNSASRSRRCATRSSLVLTRGSWPSPRLHHGVIAGEAAQRTVLAEARAAGMHESRKFLRERIGITDAPLLHRAGLEVVDQHVGLGQQLQQHLAALGLGEIEGDRALVAV